MDGVAPPDGLDSQTPTQGPVPEGHLTVRAVQREQEEHRHRLSVPGSDLQELLGILLQYV